MKLVSFRRIKSNYYHLHRRHRHHHHQHRRIHPCRSTVDVGAPVPADVGRKIDFDGERQNSVMKDRGSAENARD